MVRKEIEKEIKNSLKKLKIEAPLFSVENPNQETHGDYSSNVALILAKKLEKNPIEIAEQIKEKTKGNIFKKIEIVKPGFINFFLSESYLQKKAESILKKDFQDLKLKKEKVNVEFISANPTGPLTLGNGRGGFSGDVLANVLKKAGCQVTREYYLNDRGGQIVKLGESITGKEEHYKGDYIKDLRKKIKTKDTLQAGEKGVKLILKDFIKPAVKKMGIRFDVWFSEKSLYPKEVEKVLNYLEKKNLTYQKESALWLKTAKFQDDKDRVLIKEEKETTYFASDVAYLKNKFNRKFQKLIVFVGADHHGYLKRMQAAAECLGYKKEQVEFIAMQLVRLLKNNKEVKMSKRAGTYVTIEELINEVGLDATRFFFLERGANSHLNFNLTLAKKKSQENPVYYIQYAHARISSILKKFKEKRLKPDFKKLNHERELSLIKQLLKYEEVIETTAKDYQLQRIPQYSVELAETFHRFYHECQVLTEDQELSLARVNLIKATQIVLRDVLKLMGVSTPNKM